MCAKRTILGLSALWLVGSLTLSAASAQEYGGPWAGWFPSAFPYAAYRAGNIPTPPYFAIHPPVYFGPRVGMPYGNSPLTRPPRPVLEEVAPRQRTDGQPGAMIDNPYVDETPVATGRPKPQLLVNPHAGATAKDTQKKRRLRKQPDR